MHTCIMSTYIMRTCIMDACIMGTCIMDKWITDICIVDICIAGTFTMNTNIMDTCIMDTCAWVTRPEHPKGAKDEVKRPKGLQLEVRARRAPRLLVYYNFDILKLWYKYIIIVECCRSLGGWSGRSGRGRLLGSASGKLGSVPTQRPTTHIHLHLHNMEVRNMTFP